MSRKAAFSFYEFFAGGGMARAGLGDGWDCLFANDFDARKARTYAANGPSDHLYIGDVFDLSPQSLPGRADLAWASSPCQDFSLAGARAGLGGGRSSAFFGFWSLMRALNAEGRAPRVIAIENVVGLLTSRKGADFQALCAALHSEGYRFGALEIDASGFVPQSRPRVIVVATRQPAGDLEGSSPYQSTGVRAAHAALPDELKAGWVWWRMDAAPLRNLDLAAVLEPDSAVRWRSDAETLQLLAQMETRHRQKVSERLGSGARTIGAVFRRTRGGVPGAEVRFDGLAGCLRTPGGGSSRQLILIVDNGKIKSRWMTAREGARLMGLADDYCLPSSQSAAMKVIGDGVAVPVVRALAAQLLEPLLLRPHSAVAAE